jgi:hypothetical protein
MKAASLCQKLVLVLSIKRKVLLIKIIDTKKNKSTGHANKKMENLQGHGRNKKNSRG